MKYRVVYTEEVIYEVVFTGPEGLKEEDFFEAMDADDNSQTNRLDVVERYVNVFKKEQS